MAFGDGPCLTDKPPVGYRFSPTDQELATFYLGNKVSFRPVSSEDIKEIDAYEFYCSSPDAIVGFTRYIEREWYFFVHYGYQNQDDLRRKQGEEIPMIRKDRTEIVEEFQKQEENGKIRIVGDQIGYWRSSGKKELIYDAAGKAYAFKIHFIYFSGSPNKGKQTHWRWEEYHLITSDGSCSGGRGGDHGDGGGETRNSKVYNPRLISNFSLMSIIFLIEIDILFTYNFTCIYIDLHLTSHTSIIFVVLLCML